MQAHKRMRKIKAHISSREGLLENWKSSALANPSDSLVAAAAVVVVIVVVVVVVVVGVEQLSD